MTVSWRKHCITRLHGGLVFRPSVGEDCAYQVPISPIAVRREKLAKSMFPREAIVDNNLLERVRLDWEERAAIIDYEKFCNDIYRQGWIEKRKAK